VELLPIFRDRTPFSLFGFGTSEISFLVGVVALWYLLGRLLDRRGSLAAPKQRRMTATRLSVQLLVMILGACLFFETLQSFRDPGRYNNPVGNLAQGILFLVWSFVLVILPGFTLANGIRRRHSSPEAGA
jgi:hypothetical protein